MNFDLNKIDVKSLIPAIIAGKKEGLSFDETLRKCIQTQLKIINEGEDTNFTVDDVMKVLNDNYGYGPILDMISSQFEMDKHNNGIATTKMPDSSAKQEFVVDDIL